MTPFERLAILYKDLMGGTKDLTPEEFQIGMALSRGEMSATPPTDQQKRLALYLIGFADGIARITHDAHMQAVAAAQESQGETLQ